MSALLDFLRSGALTHPRFGSKAEVLYRAVTGNAAAVRTATQRMAEAGRQRVTTGQSGRATISNVHERVRSAKSTHEAFEIAKQAAIADLERQGITLPA